MSVDPFKVYIRRSYPYYTCNRPHRDIQRVEDDNPDHIFDLDIPFIVRYLLGKGIALSHNEELSIIDMALSNNA